MVINLAGVDTTPKEYIQKEGGYTLKCVDIDMSKKTYNGNTILKIIFENKEKLRFIEDIVITQNTLFKIKQVSDAFGFTYDNVNVNHFIGMYLVAFLGKTKVKNSAGDFVEVLKAKKFQKSAKLQNTIPAEGAVPVVMSAITNTSNAIDEIDIDESEIPF